MSDQSSQNIVPQGQGKAFAANVSTFIAVLAALLLEDHYSDLYHQLTSTGYPLPEMVALVAGFITHLLTWWTSADFGEIAINWIKGWKRIKKEFDSP